MIDVVSTVALSSQPPWSRGVSDQASPTTLDLLGRILREIQAEQRRHRVELSDVRTLVLAQVEQGRRMDRHITELRDDMKVMLKAEIMGSMGNYRTLVDHRVDELAGRIEDLEATRKP